MADKLMYISNDNTQNSLFCRLQSVQVLRLDTQLNELTNHNSINIMKKMFKVPPQIMTSYDRIANERPL